jgi:hypothetical protein
MFSLVLEITMTQENNFSNVGAQEFWFVYWRLGILIQDLWDTCKIKSGPEILILMYLWMLKSRTSKMMCFRWTKRCVVKY